MKRKVNKQEIKTFKKDIFIELEGIKKYYENETWINLCDNKECLFDKYNEYGTCYIKSKNYMYMIYKKWCI